MAVAFLGYTTTSVSYGRSKKGFKRMFSFLYIYEKDLHGSFLR